MKRVRHLILGLALIWCSAANAAGTRTLDADNFIDSSHASTWLQYSSGNTTINGTFTTLGTQDTTTFVLSAFSGQTNNLVEMDDSQGNANVTFGPDGNLAIGFNDFLPSDVLQLYSDGTGNLINGFNQSSQVFWVTGTGDTHVHSITAPDGLILPTSISQPTCNSTNRGWVWIVQGGAGVADSYQVCEKNSSNAYVWTTLGGVTTMGAFGSSPNANGATISGSTLTLQPASTSFSGGVTTGTQSFAGDKTLTGTTTAHNTGSAISLIVQSNGSSAGFLMEDSGANQVLYISNDGKIVMQPVTANNGSNPWIGYAQPSGDTRNFITFGDSVQGLGCSGVHCTWQVTSDGTVQGNHVGLGTAYYANGTTGNIWSAGNITATSAGSSFDGLDLQSQTLSSVTLVNGTDVGNSGNLSLTLRGGNTPGFTVGASLFLDAGQGNTGFGGNGTLSGGDGSSQGGSLTISGGHSNSAAGDITLQAGQPTGSPATHGAQIVLNHGDGGSGAGGNLQLNGGDDNGAAGGDVTITAGGGTPGGAIYFQSNTTFSGFIDEAQQSTPANPASGHDRLYFKSDDNLYKLTSGGTETMIGGGGGNTGIDQESAVNGNTPYTMTKTAGLTLEMGIGAGYNDDSQVVRLPDATTLQIGDAVVITTIASTYPGQTFQSHYITVKKNSGANLSGFGSPILYWNQSIALVCTDNSSANGSWQVTSTTFSRDNGDDLFLQGNLSLWNGGTVETDYLASYAGSGINLQDSLFVSPGTDVIPLTVNEISGATSDFINLKTSTPVTVFKVDHQGNTSITGTADAVELTVNGASGQTNNAINVLGALNGVIFTVGFNSNQWGLVGINGDINIQGSDDSTEVTASGFGLSNFSADVTSGSTCLANPDNLTGVANGQYVFDESNPSYIRLGTIVTGLPGGCPAGQVEISLPATGTATGDQIATGQEADVADYNSAGGVTSLAVLGSGKVALTNGPPFSGTPPTTLSGASGHLTSATVGTYGAGKLDQAVSINNFTVTPGEFTCTVNPTVKLQDCGTSATCASPVDVNNATITAAGTITTGTQQQSRIPAGDYWRIQLTAGTCTLLNFNASALVYVE